MNIHIKATQIAANVFRARFPLCRKHKTTNFLFPETQTRRTTMKSTTRATTTTCPAGEGGLMGTRVWSGQPRSGWGALSKVWDHADTHSPTNEERPPPSCTWSPGQVGPPLGAVAASRRAAQRFVSHKTISNSRSGMGMSSPASVWRVGHRRSRP
jgi:hypothetical protein